MKKVLVVGAGFGNNGAQAMLFVTIKELRQRFPNHEIVVVSNGDYDKPYKDDYAFTFIKHPGIKLNWKLSFTITDLIPQTHSFDCVYRNIINETEAIIDISGYSFSSNWDVGNSLTYISFVMLGVRRKIPVYLMPQSFGPFCYKPGIKRTILYLLSKQYLKKCRLIAAREKTSKHYLEKAFHLKNIYLSPDIVLQSKRLKPYDVYRNAFTLKEIEVVSHSVLVIPNIQLFNRATDVDLLLIYENVIQRLVDNGYFVYLLAHANSDESICEKIAYRLHDNGCVKYIDSDLNCFEYDLLVKKMDFIVSSRYHSIVMSYRNAIPAVVIGWAEKYNSLMKMVGQECYQVDFRCQNLLQKILMQVETMSKKYNLESSIIRDRLIPIQKESIFDLIDIS